MLSLEWKLFSLELNSSERDAPFWEASQRYGEAHVALLLAHREGGDEAFEAYYAAYGALRHDQRLELAPELANKAAVDAGMPDLVERAVKDPTLADAVREEYLAARELDVFGVPTLQLLPAGSVIYGPILPLAPTGDDADGVVDPRPFRAGALRPVRAEALAARSPARCRELTATPGLNPALARRSLDSLPWDATRRWWRTAWAASLSPSRCPLGRSPWPAAR